ncbi:sulfite exporter TauE/SafE family protein [Candidatus Woesearchaeota archaeon]|nr:sulfite exporter TauE/SafE family protein [Candidatus Woesearchaeota archaeon]
MSELLTLLLVFLIGIVGSFIGAQVGSGGLITIPFLIFVGLPPQVAIATNKFGSLGLRVGAIHTYWKAKKIRWEFTLGLTLFGFLGAIIGAWLLLKVDTTLLSRIVGIGVLIPLPFLFMKDFGIRKKHIPGWLFRLSYPLYFIFSIWAAFFGGGSGTIFMYIMMLTLGLTITEASATIKIPGLVNAAFAVIVFAIAGIIDYMIGIILIASMFIGGYLGARHAVKKGDVWVRGLFTLIVIASAVKLLFF